MPRWRGGPSRRGVFNTPEWFKIINEHVNFKGRSVADFGCAEGVLSLLALKNGAASACLVDHDPNRCRAAQDLMAEHYAKNYMVACAPAESFTEEDAPKSDIVILSMIIHWLENPAQETALLANKARRHAVIIYRAPNRAYATEHGHWFPSQRVLDALLAGFNRIHRQVLETQDNGKEIILAIYQREAGRAQG